MPKGYRNVGIQDELYDEIERYIKEHGRYRSVSEFIHEAIRLRLERLSSERLRIESITKKREREQT